MMDLFKRLKKSLDITSTPTAPKMGRIPLPDVGEGDVYVIDQAAMREDSGSVDSDRQSPELYITHKRKRQLSRAETPVCHPPWPAQCGYVTPPPELVAPTPRWKVNTALMEQGWKSVSPEPDFVKPKRLAPTPQPPPVPSASRSSGKASTPPDDIEKPHMKSTHFHEDGVKPRRPSLVSRPQPSPATSYVADKTQEPVKKPLKGILKPTPPMTSPGPVSLHWQLLAYEPSRRRKKLFFDVARGASYIRDHTTMPPVCLPASDLEKLAANVPLTRMSIQMRKFTQWEIVAENPEGLTCRDVFNAIHSTLNQPLTEDEHHEYFSSRSSSRQERIEKAFEQRCKDLPYLTEVTRQKGLMRVDLLEGKRIFMGLSRAPDGGDFWVLELGLPAPDLL